jgi:hypothetical protein
MVINFLAFSGAQPRATQLSALPARPDAEKTKVEFKKRCKFARMPRREKPAAAHAVFRLAHLCKKTIIVGGGSCGTWFASFA